MTAEEVVKNATITCNLSQVKKCRSSKYYKVSGVVQSTGKTHTVYIKNGSVILSQEYDFVIADGTYQSGQYTIRTNIVYKEDGSIYTKNVYIVDVVLDY